MHHTNTNLFKDFSLNTLYVNHIPDFLQRFQKQTNQFESAKASLD